MRNCQHSTMRACCVQEGHAGMLACERAEGLDGQNARRRECESAGTLPCWHAPSEVLMLACEHARGRKCWVARMRKCWQPTMRACVKGGVPFTSQGRH